MHVLILCRCVQMLMQKGKEHLCNSEKYRFLSVKWVKMGGRIQKYGGCFAKVKNLLLNREYR
jgi:hypothetical protein